jgi:replicative DNA helicase
MRDSGSIEQDADVVIGVYWEYKHTPKPENKEKIELILLKQRNGAIGTIDAIYRDKYTRFENKTSGEVYDEAEYWQK